MRYDKDMSTPPLLSIIIPVWNSDNAIRRITGSILDQSFQDFELILVDDGSTDDTLAVLHSIEMQDARVKVHTKPNGGPSSARNIGLEKATGAYIQFYDADDTIPRDALSIITSAIQHPNCDLLVSGWRVDLQTPKGLVKDYKRITPKHEYITENISENVLRSLGSSGTLYNLWNKLFRADIIRGNHLRFREDLRFGEDTLFSLDYFKHVRTFSIIPDVTYYYLTNSETSVFASSSIAPEYRTANDAAIVDFIGDHPTEAEHDLALWLRWRWLMSYWSLVAASQKSFAEKRRLIAHFSPAHLTIVKTPKYIGLKKYVLQLLASIARMSVITSLLPGWLFHIFKQGIISVKTRFMKQ